MKTTLMIASLCAMMATSLYAGEGIDKKYQGDWVRATLKQGEDNPTPSGCLRTKMGSVIAGATLTAKGGVFSSANYFGNEECGGDNHIKAKFIYEFASVSKDENAQMLRVPNQKYTITITGQEPVKQLNEQGVCGYKNWEAKAYSSEQSPLKDCTFDNMGLTIPPYINNKDLQNWRTRLSVQGNGLALASSSTPDGDFDHVHYYSRKP